MALQRSTQSSSFAGFFLIAITCVVLMFTDARTRLLEPVRLGIGALVTPIQFAADLPARVGGLIDLWLESEESVRSVYNQVVDENARLRFRLQRMQALELENRDLRRILSAPQRGDTRVLVGQLLEVSLDPYKQTILVNRGAKDGLFVGQPVFDPEGLLGQVSDVMPLTSAVTLITDPGHALPVQVTRHGLRAIAMGTGKPDRLRIVYLTPNDDIRKGDRLVTSGLGGRFPAGYPVARVSEVVEDAGEPFLRVTATPIARIAHNKHVLLVWHGSRAGRQARSR
ncbi:MAG TPA: rod shape-determining protein MreC [Arenicellales bacterium]|nr:rod shape-determining protein MreC [Arenicellales bacterium]